MSSVIGILCDVSYSMKENAQADVEGEGGEWVRSIFRVIDNLVKHDVSEDNHVFAVAVGARCNSEIFDIIGTIREIQIDTTNNRQDLTFDDKVDKTFEILEKNGAPSIRKWAHIDILRKAVSDDMAHIILNKLKTNNNFVHYFVHTCLPPICRDLPKKVRFGTVAAALFLPFPYNIITAVAGYRGKSLFDVGVTSAGKTATKEDIDEVTQKAISFFIKDADSKCIISVHNASDIIHGYVDEVEEKDISKERADELLKTVEPIIYGKTPLFRALTIAGDLIETFEFCQHKKILFVLSDGAPTDTGSFSQILSSLKANDVSVVTCYISRSQEVQPKRLYSSSQYIWDEHAKFLFDLSSVVTTDKIPRAIFAKRDWQIDITNNETKLFLHVNHPDNLKEACDLARNIVYSQDTLCDVLSSVSLDTYIDITRDEVEAKEQVKDTCYANASATVLHLATKRILGRKNGYPDFNTLLEEIVTSFGQHGANSLRVMQEFCPRYRLRYKSITEISDALNAIIEKRPILATFALTKSEWKTFDRFFRKNGRSILRKSDLYINRPTTENRIGHAVVLTSFNSECLRFMNSWGPDWGDNGFFKIENASVLNLEFIDVYWTKEDLTSEEKQYYKTYGAEVAGKLFQTLKGLRSAEYQCPKCRQLSLVTDFTGTLSKVKCPNCGNTFDCREAGNILALNMYLLSLCR